MLCRFSFLDIQCQFQPIGAASRTAARIVSQWGLMDVGLEIKEINPQRVGLILKSHLTFLSCVSALSWMSARGRTAPPWPRWPAPRARARLRVSAGVTFRTETHFAFITERTPQRWGQWTHTDTLSREELQALMPFQVRPHPRPPRLSLCVHSASVSGLMADSTALKTDQLQQNLLSPAPSGPHGAAKT